MVKNEQMSDRIKAARLQLKMSLAEFGEMAGGVSSTSAWKWEHGGDCSDDKLKIIGDAVNKTVTELRYGLKDINGPQLKGRVPLISWATASDLSEDLNNLHASEPEAWYGCPVPHSENTFVLRVVGDLMDSGDSEGYPDGFLIFIDPKVSPQHNDDVIVRASDGTATFRRLQITQDGNFLVALNSEFRPRITPLSEDARICGVVIFSGRIRR